MRQMRESMLVFAMLSSVMIASCGSDKPVSADPCQDIVSKIAECEGVSAATAPNMLAECRVNQAKASCAADTKNIAKCFNGKTCSDIQDDDKCSEHGLSWIINCNMLQFAGMSKVFTPIQN